MMRVAIALAAALGFVLLPTSVASARPAAKASAKADWVHSFSVTPEGGFRMGNPKAKIAIVEYGSLVCPHCRHFDETAMKPLIGQYIRTGKASYEFRPFLLDGLDLAATLVARCNGPAHFFPMAEQLYATQPAWKEKVLKLPSAEQNRLSNLPQEQMLLSYAKISGIIPMAAARGIPPARAQACLKDQHAAEQLTKIEQAGQNLGVDGTPGFFVNGKKVDAYDWATLEPFLKEAGG